MTMTVTSAVRIGGEPTAPSDVWPVTVTEPATGGVLAELVGGGRSDARRAADAAAGALDEWTGTRPATRAVLLRRIAGDLRAQSDDLGELISRETGKLLTEARAEVNLSAAFFDWFADAVSTCAAECWTVVPGAQHVVTQRPLGVVAVFTPWNFPLSIPARKMAPALAAGCTVLFKPSEVTPLSALRLAEIAERHLPENAVCTVVGEPAEVADSWISDSRVRGLTFTGSTAVGQLVAAAAAREMKRCVLELGGSAPFVVLDDADPVRAAELLAAAKYRNNGQSCIAANAAWVPRRLLDDVVEAFAAATQRLVLGNPLHETSTLGPLTLPTDPSRIRELVDDADRRGAHIVPADVAVPRTGSFCPPVICVNPPANARVCTEEIFGPFLPIRPYDDVQEVIASTRGSRYGLAAYVTGRDTNRAAAVARALDVGIVGINTATPNTPQVPFGGLKHSGIGYEGGKPGLDAFFTYQTVATTSA